MKYELFMERSAKKALVKISSTDKDRIIKAISSLAEETRPDGSKKLSGREAWRIRIGQYRIIYKMKDKELLVLAVVISHKKDVYR